MYDNHYDLVAEVSIESFVKMYNKRMRTYGTQVNSSGDGASQTGSIKIPSAETNLRDAYFSLFHEMQFRSIKNAMMNYHQAEVLQAKGDLWNWVTAFLAAASTGGVFAAIIQKGEMLSTKCGLAGLVGLPISGILTALGSSTSEVIPSFHERAKKHSSAAAGWMQIAEGARTMQLQMKLDQSFDMEKVISSYNELTAKKEGVSKEILIPRNSHKQFSTNPQSVYLAIARRRDMYKQFLTEENENSSNNINLKTAEDIYF